MVVMMTCHRGRVSLRCRRAIPASVGEIKSGRRDAKKRVAVATIVRDEMLVERTSCAWRDDGGATLPAHERRYKLGRAYSLYVRHMGTI